MTHRDTPRARFPSLTRSAIAAAVTAIALSAAGPALAQTAGTPGFLLSGPASFLTSILSGGGLPTPPRGQHLSVPGGSNNVFYIGDRCAERNPTSQPLPGQTIVYGSCRDDAARQPDPTAVVVSEVVEEQQEDSSEYPGFTD